LHFFLQLSISARPLLSFALTILDLDQRLLNVSFDELLRALSNPSASRLMSDRHTLNLA
jgi:hypothetical protein